MKKRMGFCYRISAMLMLILMVFSMLLCSMPLVGSAVEVTKTEKSYDIAVVFDNSGSMYDDESWCRAKYAMEIFASMIDYKKDKLHIFPMWGVTTDGSKPSSGGSYSAIEIKSKEDIDKISKMYTVSPSGTPFAPVTEAHNYLKSSKADEKWLVILTDGLFNQEARGQLSTIDVQKRIPQLATKEIKVQYLGFGEAVELKANEEKNFFSKKSTGASLKDDLIGICNAIFQRSILPDNRLKGDKLNLDLSMKNVIVFVQGANAKVSSLVDSSGKQVNVSLDSGQRKYSEIGAGGSEYAGKTKVDKSLSGQVVTFTGCPKGEYKLTYAGADKIQIFYEPDVSLDVSFVNSDGQKIEDPNSFVEGEYTVTSKIIDASTGEDVTSHELMGKNVDINTYVKTSEDSEYKKYENGSKIVFEADEKTDIYIEGEYLGKYKISSKDDSRFDWLTDIKIPQKPAEFKIDAEVLQSQSWYIIKEHDKWQPIKVSATLDGKPLTDEQLANVKLTVTPSEDLKYRCEPIKGESAFNIYIAQDENGQYVEPETGGYSLDLSATYEDEYGRESSAKDDVSFDIERYSKMWVWLIRLIIAAAILALIIFLLTRKAWPWKLTFIEEKPDGKTKKHKVSIGSGGKGIKVFPVYSALSVTGEKKSKVYQKFSKSACFYAKELKPKHTVSSFKINGIEYNSPEYKDSMGNPFSGDIRSDTRIEVSFNDGHGTIAGRLLINK